MVVKSRYFGVLIAVGLGNDIGPTRVGDECVLQQFLFKINDQGADLVGGVPETRSARRSASSHHNAASTALLLLCRLRVRRLLLLHIWQPRDLRRLRLRLWLRLRGRRGGESL